MEHEWREDSLKDWTEVMWYQTDPATEMNKLSAYYTEVIEYLYNTAP